MGTYQIETDQGTFEVQTDEPSTAHPDLPGVGQLKDLASGAVSAISPEAPAQGGFLQRLAQGTKEMFAPGMEGVKRLFNPNAGQFGPSRVLEQAGQQVGSAVRAAGQNIGDQLVTGRGPASMIFSGTTRPEAQNEGNPYIKAAVGSGIGTVADVTSNSLTPSSFQQQLGAEGIGIAAQPLKEGISNVLDQASIGPARRATGFMKPDLRSTHSPFETIRKTAQANAAGKEMLDRGAIPLLGGPGKMQDNALQILAEGRNKVNGVIDSLEQAGQTIPTADFGQKIADSVKAKFPDEVKAVNSVINDLESINPEAINPSAVAELKQRWGKFGFQDKTVGTTVADVYRKAYKAADQVLKSHIESVAPDLLPQYVQGMKAQETAMTALKGITNKGARMAANMPVSLPTAIMGAGDVASGNFKGAAAKIGATQAAINSGAALLANTLRGAKLAVQSGVRPGSLAAIIAAAKNNTQSQPKASTEQPDGFKMPPIPNPFSPGGPTQTGQAEMIPKPISQPLSPLRGDKLAYAVGVQALLDKDYEKAKTYAQKAIKLNPNNLEARRMLERIALKEGKNIDAYRPKQ